jgi:prophage regulatory protein
MPELDRIIRLKTVLQRSGLSRSTVYRKIEEGTFPKQVKLGTSSAGWKESELNRWIADPPRYRPAQPRNELDLD